MHKSIPNCLDFNAPADRVTEEWRIRNMACRSVRTRKYTNDGENYTSDNSSNYVSSSVVKSLSQRWSAGLFGSYHNSNYSNIVYSLSVKPAIEYNIFPWDVSDRKVLTIAYYIGPEWKKYYEETILISLTKVYGNIRLAWTCNWTDMGRN